MLTFNQLPVGFADRGQEWGADGPGEHGPAQVSPRLGPRGGGRGHSAALFRLRSSR